MWAIAVLGLACSSIFGAIAAQKTKNYSDVKSPLLGMLFYHIGIMIYLLREFSQPADGQSEMIGTPMGPIAVTKSMFLTSGVATHLIFLLITLMGLSAHTASKKLHKQ